jgi:N-acetylmuramoyl-L-alanine amidase
MRRLVSAILDPVKIVSFLVFFVLLGVACLLAAQSDQQANPAPPQQETNPPTHPESQGQATPENPPLPSAPAAPEAPQAPPPPPVHIGPVIVLDPAHGGSDYGARGSSGAIEKDVVLRFGQLLRGELQGQGYRVVMTRTDDSDPSYDDRDAAANLYRDMIYISLHVSTTGAPGTARVYYYSFWTPTAGAVASTGAASRSPTSAVTPPAPPGWIPWQIAQRGFQDASRQLADDLQTELSKQFAGSPAKSTAAEVRELRSVVGPAAAVEVSSVQVADPETLANMAQPLAQGILRGLQVYRPRTAQGSS